MFTVKDQVDQRYIVGFRLEDGEHGVFKNTEKAQQVIFETYNDAWNYMDLLERKGIDVSDLTVVEC